MSLFETRRSRVFLGWSFLGLSGLAYLAWSYWYAVSFYGGVLELTSKPVLGGIEWLAALGVILLTYIGAFCAIIATLLVISNFVGWVRNAPEEKRISANKSGESGAESKDQHRQNNLHVLNQDTSEDETIQDTVNPD